MTTTVAPALPEYVMHKRTRAARIVKIQVPADEWNRMCMLTLALPEGGTVEQKVVIDYLSRFQPEVGGFFIQPDGGPASYAAETAFLRDYSRVPNPAQVANMAELERLLMRRDTDVVTVALPQAA